MMHCRNINNDRKQFMIKQSEMVHKLYLPLPLDKWTPITISKPHVSTCTTEGIHIFNYTLQLNV
jgi:hypothetical protein